ncbi:NACHT domain-containing protein [Sulfurimonas sp. HSL3-2]|uniref:NACHT domain-containing protein n=1 Tax=Hydrocurvibacter mobilis TaxID=3131936 RepID=UPI0031F86E65
MHEIGDINLFGEIIEKKLAKELFDYAFKSISNFINSSGGQLSIDNKELESYISHHLNSVKNWSEEISFFDLKKAKSTDAVYVPLNLYVYPTRIRIEPNETIEAIPLNTALTYRETLEEKEEKKNKQKTVSSNKSSDIDQTNSPNHFVILGQPGAGKTTTMKYLCRELLIGNENLLKHNNFPMLIRLREVNKRQKIDQPDQELYNEILWSNFHEILGLKIIYPTEFNDKNSIKQRSAYRKKLLVEALESLSPLIILDGFDEISFISSKQTVLNELKELGTLLEKSCMILTSRSSDFKYNLDKFHNFELKPLDDMQIKTFAKNWLVSEIKADDFLKQLYDSPFKDTSIRPLTIAHLCAIYERNEKIPDKPKTVYRKVVTLLINEWDEQRSINRDSAYSQFESDRKFEFLSNLAYDLTIHVKKTIFDTNDLKNSYERIFENFDLPKGEAKKVANEIESHTGLFIEAGYDMYEFSHKSLQEYLTAEYIVKLPALPEKKEIIYSLANELAIATSISSNPSAYFYELVFNRLKVYKQFPSTFIQTFINRLLVEKPDFHKSLEVGWALLLLNSMYFGLTEYERGQRSLFIIDTMTKEFEYLTNLIKDRVSETDILSIYDIELVDKTLDGENILRLKKSDKYNHKVLSKYSDLLISRLPKHIMIKENLINNKVT